MLSIGSLRLRYSSNAPVISDQGLTTLGEGGYADGIRARLIRDRLLQVGKAKKE